MKKNLSKILLTALVGFPQISETIYTPALPNVAKNLMASAYMVEATLSIYFLGFAIGVLIWGTVSDWTGRRLAMLMGLFIYCFATFQCGVVESVEGLLGWRFVQAFGASVGSVIVQTIIRDSFDGTARSKLFALMSGALAFSPAIGPVLGGLISQEFGWRANFAFLVGLAFILIIWTFLTLPETRPAHVETPSKDKVYNLLRQMMSSKFLWGHVLLIGATNAIIFGFYQEAPFIFIEHLGMEPSHYGLFGLMIAAATILAASICYRIHLNPDTFIKYGAMIVTSGGLLLTLLVNSSLFDLSHIGLLLTILTLFSIFFGIGLIIPNSLSHALKHFQKSLGTAGSIFGALYYIFIAFSTWIMSLIHTGSPLPLPLYMTVLGGVLITGSLMIKNLSDNF